MNEPTIPFEEGETMAGLHADQTVFGRHVLIARLGRGGMGEVWSARDRGLERSVALKFLPEVVAQDRTAVDELKQETRRALLLTHPHIVRVYDFLTDGLRAAISMELVEGATLSQMRVLHPEKVLGATELRPLLLQACEALDYAHAKARVVHRDLKPSNLMVNAKGELKVADFGISATLTESTIRVSRLSGGVMGTPLYMSPQQLMGSAPSVADDIYSLGATVYELLTGKPPFHAGDIALQVQEMVPPRMDLRRVELGTVKGVSEAIPPEWEETIAACLAKEPADRPRSVREFAERMRLERSRGGTPVSGAQSRSRTNTPASAAPAAPSVPAATKSSGRRTLLIATAAFVLGGILVLELLRPTVRNRRMRARAESVAPAVATPRRGARWTIPDLGMAFVPVPRTNVLFSIWETRVRDYVAFLGPEEGKKQDTGYSAYYRDAAWRDPGFPQGADHPVVMVTASDAADFCAWLTARERAAGRLTAQQSYRLPTDAEWSAAEGPTEFPWGDQFPPPPGAGNIYDAGSSVGGRDKSLVGPAYEDGFDNTAPVGVFAPNSLGIYDLSGNVAEWVGDRAGGFRGSSFQTSDRKALATGARGREGSAEKTIGFRVVCDLGEPNAGIRNADGDAHGSAALERGR